MADKFWESSPIVTPAQSGAPVFIPNPGAELDAESKRVGIDTSLSGEERADRKEVRDVDNRQFDNAETFRARYERLPAVQEYRTAVGALSQALKRSPDGTGDVGLIYDYVKALDPTSVVREAEVGMAQSSAAYLDAKAAEIKKQFGIEGGGALPQEVRDRMRREMIHSVTSRVQGYNQQRERFKEYATRYGIDPFEVIGDHDGRPFVEQFKAYDERSKGPALPRAVGAHDQGGSDIDGVTEKGTGFRPEPGLYHLGDTVADMIGKGAGIEEIGTYLRDQYAPFGVEPGPEMLGKVGEIIRGHKANPSKPVKSLAPGWDSFHLIPDNAETPWYSGIADSPVGAAALGVADVGTMGFGDELAGAIGGDELDAAWDYSREERPLSYGAGQLTGAFLLPTGAPGAARNAGVSALRAGEGMAAARTAAASAATRRVTGEAAVYGGAHGAGAADGDIEDRLAGAAVEGSLGALGGRLVGKVGEKVATRAPRTAAAPSEAAEYAAAAERQGIEPYAPDMSPRAAAAAGKLAQTQAGVGRITDRAKLTLDTAKEARDRIARSLGQPMEGEGLGYRISQGASAAIKREHDKGAALYRTAERAAGDARIRPVDAFQTLSDEIDAMAETGLSETAGNIFKRVRDRMTEGPMTVQALRDIRTSLREDLATFNVRGGASSARAKRVMDAITKDIDDGLRQHGLEDAADAFQRADGQWQSYIELTDDVVTPLIGKDGSASGEQVAKRLMADLKGNNARAVKLLNALPAEEQAIARSSVIQALGRSSAGRQDAEGGAFSLNDFLTHWNEIGETAKSAYFGKDARAALNDLAVVAQGSKAAQRFANHSNSGGAINAIPEVGLGLATAGLSALMTNVTARMLTSQRMVRWLAGAGKKPNPAAAAAHVERLSAIAKAEPALANDILGLQSVLQQQLSGAAPRSVGRAYAEEEENSRREQPAKGKSDDAQ